MSSSVLPCARWVSRPFVASLVVAFAAAGLLVLAVPVPAAAPTAPWFSPNVLVNTPSAYTGYQPSMAIDGEGVLYLAFGGWGGSAPQGPSKSRIGKRARRRREGREDRPPTATRRARKR